MRTLPARIALVVSVARRGDDCDAIDLDAVEPCVMRDQTTYRGKVILDQGDKRSWDQAASTQALRR